MGIDHKTIFDELRNSMLDEFVWAVNLMLNRENVSMQSQNPQSNEHEKTS